MDDDCDNEIDEGAAGSVLTVDQLVAGDLVVTEIMNNPAVVTDNVGEWFEIYNNSGREINLNGLEIGRQWRRFFRSGRRFIGRPRYLCGHGQ